MIPIFALKLIGTNAVELFVVGPNGISSIWDFNFTLTTGAFYDNSTFGSPCAVQFGKYIYIVLTDTCHRYDTINNTISSIRTLTGYTFQNHYEHHGGMYLTLIDGEWYLTVMYVSGNNSIRAERLRISNNTWATSGTFANFGDNSHPQFRYFFNNQVYWFNGSNCYRYDTISMTAGTVAGAAGDHRSTSMCMHNNNVYLSTAASSSQLNIYLLVGGAWNLIYSITGLTNQTTGLPTRLFSDGTNMYLLAYTNVANVGWRCYQINVGGPSHIDISTTVLPAFLRNSGLSSSCFKGFHVDSHNNPANPEIWLTYTAAFTTVGASLAWYQWMGPSSQMVYSGDVGEGGPDFMISYDWSGGGHYAFTAGEPYIVMEGTPTPILGGKTRITFRVSESNTLPLNSDVDVQLHFGSDAEPPRALGTVSNPLPAGSVIDSNTVRLIADESILQSLDWHNVTDGIAPGQRVSITLKAVGA